MTKVYTTDMPFYGDKISDNMSRMPSGSLICHNVRIARTGIQDYFGHEIGVRDRANDRVKAYRLAEDVFNEDTLKSFEGLPITLNHPQEMVNTSTYKHVTRGHIQNVRAESNRYIVVDMVVNDEELIKLIENGDMRQVSAGYWCNYEPHKDGFKQKDIIANHLAVVKYGRAGEMCAVRDEDKRRNSRKMDKAAIIAACAKTMDADELAQVIKQLDEKPVVEAKDESKGILAVLKALSGSKTKDSEVDVTSTEPSEQHKQMEILQSEIETIKKNAEDSKSAMDEMKATIDKMASFFDADDDEDDKEETKDADGDDDEDDKKKKMDDAYSTAMDALKPVLATMNASQQKAAKDALRTQFGKKSTGDNGFKRIAEITKKKSEGQVVASMDAKAMNDQANKALMDARQKAQDELKKKTERLAAG